MKEESKWWFLSMKKDKQLKKSRKIEERVNVEFTQFFLK